ncbi:MAG: peptide-methionine (S)-S-oxide reductase MsrA [Candidatus Rhabdochlamydia sp.]
MGKEQLATFAGGCFWCIQHDFDHLPGILQTQVGYTGGSVKDPSYEEICLGKTGHVEAVQVLYDSKQISFGTLLDFYWHHIDPTRSDGQFCDIGSQYRPIIFYHNTQQKELAEQSKKKIQLPCLVEILPIQTFYPAESHHQRFYKKDPARYESYVFYSGRKQRLKDLWKE